MVKEKHIVYQCSLCQTTYSQKGDAIKCELSCGKLSGSPDISVLDLTPRTYNILKRAGINTVDEVLGTTDAYLSKLKGFGKVCLSNLHEQLEPFGIQTEIEKFNEPIINKVDKWNARRQKFLNRESLSENDEWLNRKSDLPENQIRQFVDEQDWVKLYNDYRWNSDTWKNGFPNILRLEMQMRYSLEKGEIKRQDILDVASWVKLYLPRITSPESIPLTQEVQ